MATPGGPFTGGQGPIITSPPQSQAVNAGQNVLFTISVAAVQPLFYQWRHNGELLDGATNAQLELQQVHAAQAGQYSVVVYNAAGSAASPPATLTVRVPAFVVVAPQPRVVPRGGNTTFTVVAVGDNPLSYQWQWEGNDLSNATNATLVLTNVQLTQAGRYTVVISDNYSSISTPPALLTVTVRASITRQPQSAMIVSGDIATFRVEANGTLPLTYIWRRGITVLTNLVSNSSNSVFAVASVRANINTTNTYSVLVTNLGGSQASQPFTLITLADSDADHAPDDWERLYGFDTGNVADGGFDSDGDGLLNWQEFVAGTDPTNRLSYLKVELSSTPIAGTHQLEFMAVSNRTYSVLWTAPPDTLVWRPLAHFDATPTNRIETLSDTNPAPSRLYRLSTPAVFE